MTMFQFAGIDQDWANEQTKYWFDSLEGATELDENIELGDEFGVADQNGELTILDAEGHPVGYDWDLAPRAKRALVEAYEAARDES